MPPPAFDLDIELIPATAPSPDEMAANPLAGLQLEEVKGCTPHTPLTWSLGHAKCPTCC